MFTLQYRLRNMGEWISMLPWRITPLRNMFYPHHDTTKPYPRQQFWLERLLCPLLGALLIAFTISAYFFGGFTPAAGLYEKVLLGIMVGVMMAFCGLGFWAGMVRYRSPHNWVQPRGTTFTSTA